MRLTRDGWIVASVAVALVVVASTSGQNMLALLASMAMASLGCAGFACRWNLRNLEVIRHIPMDVYARRDARGALVLRNRRRSGAALAVWLTDSHEAAGWVSHVPPEAEVAVSVTWRIPTRGATRLEPIQIRSTFPLGLFECTVAIGCPTPLVVWPEPLSGTRVAVSGCEPGQVAGAGVDGNGDFQGLRQWVPGDSLRRVHWRTTARVGDVMVVNRSREASIDHEVVVPDVGGAEWEQSLSYAAGAIETGIVAGRRIRLVLPAELADRAPRTLVSGPLGRRHLLGLLAVLPAREAT